MSDILQELDEVLEQIAAVKLINGEEAHLIHAEQFVEDHHHAIRAALELKERMAWQPIETAPKDGTAIFLLLPDSGIPQVARFFGRHGWRTTWDEYILHGLDHPTHWMPIYDLPAQGEQDDAR